MFIGINIGSKARRKKLRQRLAKDESKNQTSKRFENFGTKISFGMFRFKKSQQAFVQAKHIVQFKRQICLESAVG